jgi:sulfide:quinone oxidoreductase
MLSSTMPMSLFTAAVAPDPQKITRSPVPGADLKAYDRAGTDITTDLFAPSGFLKVDADYTPKPDDQWRAEDWPETYQSPRYANVFGIGIAFAPPHAISTPGPAPTAR